MALIWTVYANQVPAPDMPHLKTCVLPEAACRNLRLSFNVCPTQPPQVSGIASKKSFELFMVIFLPQNFFISLQYIHAMLSWEDWLLLI